MSLFFTPADLRNSMLSAEIICYGDSWFVHPRANLAFELDNIHALQPILVAVVDQQSEGPLKASYKRLNEQITDLPALHFVRPSGAPELQARVLLGEAKSNIALVLTGWPAASHITGPRKQVDSLAPTMRLIMEDALTSEALSRSGYGRPKLDIGYSVVDPAAGKSSISRYLLARSAQTILFVLTILLAGTGAFVYWRVRVDLDTALDRDLADQLAAIIPVVGADGVVDTTSSAIRLPLLQERTFYRYTPAQWGLQNGCKYCDHFPRQTHPAYRRQYQTGNWR